jgi:selenocysteine lyase/cysteine desulfurase
MSDQAVVEHLWTKYGIALRADNFYSRVPEVYEVPTMIRISLVHYNTPEEVERLLKGLDELDQP